MLAAASTSASVRVAIIKSPLKLRSEAPLPTRMLETESVDWVASATVKPRPDKPSTRTLSISLTLESVSTRNTPVLSLDTVSAASSAMSTTEPKRLLARPTLVVLAIALIEAPLTEKDSREFSSALYLFLTAWLLA